MNSVILAASAALSIVLTTGAMAQDAGDPAAGAKIFNRCKACHAIGDGAKNKIGPELNGIVGEKPGAVEGYNFSAGFKEWAADKPAWNEQLLTEWLTNPKAVVKGTKMVFPGLKKADEMKNVIAYLAGFDESGKERDPAEALSAAASAQ